MAEARGYVVFADEDPPVAHLLATLTPYESDERGECVKYTTLCGEEGHDCEFSGTYFTVREARVQNEEDIRQRGIPVCPTCNREESV